MKDGRAVKDVYAEVGYSATDKLRRALKKLGYIESDGKRVLSHTDGSTFIRIELPQRENVMISARSNKVVWEEFKEFAKKHSVNFRMGDLLAQALKEYRDKYK